MEVAALISTSYPGEGYELFHKTPFKAQTLDELGEPIATANPSFDLEKLLQEALILQEELDDRLSNPSLSPPASPGPQPPPGLTDMGLEDLGDLSDLSPLPSPYVTPTHSPKLSATHLFPSQEDITLPHFPRLLPPSQADRPGSSDRPDHNDAPSSGEVSLSDQSGPRPSQLRLKDRRREASRRKRQEKRRKGREESFSNYQIRENIQKRLDGVAPVQSDFKTEDSNAAATAFVGVDDGAGTKKKVRLEDLVGECAKRKFQYVPWNGKLPTSVCDAGGRDIAFLAGVPDDADWPRLAQQAAEALESRRCRLSLSKQERSHRRGQFPALRCGVSHGGGSTEPTNLRNTSTNQTVLEELSSMEPFRRLAGFATSVMASRAPKLYRYYVENLAKLHANHPHLKRLFPSSVFAAASYNFGPRTVCFKHKDFANLPFGLCAVTALGSFDPRKGGHLVLWDCHLVVEFPPGSTILLPSAIVAHSNVAISPDETRYSFAQYTAGGLFRWVQNKCMLSADYYASLSAEEMEAEKVKNEGRFAFGLSLFERRENKL